MGYFTVDQCLAAAREAATWEPRYKQSDLDAFESDMVIDVGQAIEGLLQSTDLKPKQKEWFRDHAIAKLIDIWKIKFSGSRLSKNHPGEWISRWLVAWLERFEDDPIGYMARYGKCITESRLVVEHSNDPDDYDFDDILRNPTKSELRKFYSYIKTRGYRPETAGEPIIKGIVNADTGKHYWCNALELTHIDILNKFSTDDDTQDWRTFIVLWGSGEVVDNPDVDDGVGAVDTLRRFKLPTRV